MWLLMVLVKTIFQTKSKLNDNILLALELYWLTPIVSVFHSLWNLKLGCSQLLIFKSCSGFMKFYAFFVSAHSIEKSAFYRGADCISKLMETLRSWLKWVYSEKQTFRWLQISVADRQKYPSPMTINCCICGDSITIPACYSSLSFNW